MNKRITELMAIAQESAGKEYPNAVNLDLTDPNVIALFDRVHFSYQKFAELIVRECADYANWYQANSRYTDIAKAIKEHFGVEL